MSEHLKDMLAALENIADRYDDAIGRDARELTREYGVGTAEELEKSLTSLADDYRLLRIGIIGRVKAGKSSLLNAVFFDGEDVLPKAATPMTASLTQLTWGEEYSATVEYFTADDIRKIEEDNRKYESLFRQALESLREKAAKKLADAVRRLGGAASDDEERLRRKAARSIEDDSLAASHDQFERMRRSPRFQEFAAGKSPDIINAADRTRLMEELGTYVGADGSLMPFTRSVELRLPQESLRDIAVVDTPGLNDPVVSRSERTNAYLNQCDVVFIVSPAGQFVSLEDTGLMDRLSSRQGVRELYLVASQADNQILGGESELAHGDLHRAVAHVEEELNAHARETLTYIRQACPETAGQFDQLLAGDNRTIFTSSVCNALIRRYDEPATWDATMRTVYANLSQAYPDHFDNREAALAALSRLDGTSRIAAAIADARQKKDAILTQRRNDLLAGQRRSADDYAAALQERIQGKIAELQRMDLAAIQTRQQNLQTLRAKGTAAVDEAFDTTLDEFRCALRNAIEKKRGDLFAEAREGVNNAEDTETRTRTWTTGWWIFKRHHSESYSVTVVMAGAVRNQLNNLRADLEQTLLTELERCKAEWKKSVQTQVTRALRDAVNDDNAIDINAVKMAMRRQVNSMEIPTLDFSACTFTSTASGKLEGSSAESYMEKAQEYLSELRDYFQKQTKAFIQAVEDSVRQFSMSDMLFGDINSQLEELEQSLQNKQASIQRLEACLRDLEEARHA